ncbi:tRNA preQ1(34) S-adenosylmethionine ribosyltransferase-isomerase QueA [soil metagenome]
MSFDLADYDFDLPEEQIAQFPASARDSARMLVVDRAAGTFTDAHFVDLPKYLEPTDTLVLNATRVFPARLVGRRASGGRAELLLERAESDGTWRALAKPGRKLQVGASLDFGGNLIATVDEVFDDGRRRFRFNLDGDAFWTALEEAGRAPLPPYIRRPDEDESLAADRERYQTVYARERGSIAAPTAGLHFTEAILDQIRTDGPAVVEVTLHVGYGTFEPVKTDDLRKHQVASESFEIDEAAASIIRSAKQRSNRVIAVGTTTTRALESAGADGPVAPSRAETSLTITPGYKFQVVDGLLTNFHLPKSSLLVLVSTFGGRELILEAYRHAAVSGYRFYSYGDCMLIV